MLKTLKMLFWFKVAGVVAVAAADVEDAVAEDVGAVAVEDAAAAVVVVAVVLDVFAVRVVFVVLDVFAALGAFAAQAASAETGERAQVYSLCEVTRTGFFLRTAMKPSS